MTSPKMKSLKNYCLQLRWTRPDIRTLAPRIMQLAQAEGLKIDQETCEKLIEGTKSDIRQIINFLQMWRKTATSINANQANDKYVIIYTHCEHCIYAMPFVISFHALIASEFSCSVSYAWLPYVCLL